MSRIDRYLATALLLGALPVLLLLLGLFGFIVLAEELEDVGQGRYEDADAIRVALLSLPRIAVDLLPVATLLGGVMALGNLASGHELTALRAVGLSQWRLAWPMVCAAVLLSAAVLLAQQFVVPVLEQGASELRAKSLQDTVHSGAVPAPGGRAPEFWTRSGDQFIRVGDVRFGTVPAGIEIYELGPERTVRRALQAAWADVIGPQLWLLHDVTDSRIGADGVVTEVAPQLQWPSFLSPEQMASLIAPIETLTLADLNDYVRYLEASGLDSHRYRFRLWQVLSLPVGLLAMCLLGLPFVLGSVRARPAGARILFGASVGIGFYLVEQTASQLAVLYELPALPMATLPDVALLLAGVYALSRAE